MKTLTVKQAAERLGVSPSLIYALVAARRLRHERIGLKRGVIRIPADAIEEYRQRSLIPAEVPGEAPRQSSDGNAATFKSLDSDRLLQSWSRQGVLKRRSP